jgi:hypothetical protein
MLAPRPAGAKDIYPDVILLYVDVHVALHNRHNLYKGEGGVTAVGSVER